MKKFLLLVLFATALHAEPSYFHPDGWTLGVAFPGKPKVSEKKTSHPKGDIVEARAVFEENAHVWGAERTTFSIPIPPDRHEAAYEGGKLGMLKARSGTLVKEEVIDICGTAGRRYLVEYRDGTSLADHRVVIVGSTVFQFMYERPISEADSAHEFFRSIQKKG